MFQVVPPCGGHLLPVGDHLHQNGFKSCPRVGGILAKVINSEDFLLCFKSCPRVGGISFAQTFPQEGGCFKSCPRVGGIKDRANRLLPCVFQVVPPCGGHQALQALHELLIDVSSRAPVWGASFVCNRVELLNDGFQVVPQCGGHRS